MSPRRNSRKKKGRRATQSVRKGDRPSHQPTIPTAIRNKNVWFGRAGDSTNQVYGFFDSAGRFCRRVEVERFDRATEHWSSFAHIPHHQIAYRRTFQQMTHQQVRAEVYRRCGEWRSYIGTVVVARKDKKPLLPQHLEGVWMYCDYILDLFGEGEGAVIGRLKDQKVVPMFHFTR